MIERSVEATAVLSAVDAGHPRHRCDVAGDDEISLQLLVQPELARPQSLLSGS